MKEELRQDGLEQTLSDELSALEKKLEMDKEAYIRLMKDEIVPFIEEEIVVRYYFQQAGIELRIRYDDTLHQALRSERIEKF